jgi:hypothetical protein
LTSASNSELAEDFFKDEETDDDEELLEQPDEEEDLEYARELAGDSSEDEVQGNGKYIQEIAAWSETDPSQMRRRTQSSTVILPRTRLKGMVHISKKSPIGPELIQVR